MSKRTVRKQGTLMELIPGKKYLIRLFLGWVPDPRRAGGKKRKYYTQTVYGTRSNAQEILDELIRAKSDDSLDIDAVDLTVEAYLERWIKQVSTRDVRESTSETQIAMLRKDIIPVLGRLRLASLSTAHVDRLISTLQDNRGLAARTVHYNIRTLSKALNKAIAWNLISTNPVKGASLPKIEPRDLIVFDTAEAIRFQITALQRRKGAPLLLLLAGTGMRPAEAYALRWSDVDLLGNRVHINRSLVRYTGGYRFDLPKTKRSKRLITLNSSLTKLLEALKRSAKGAPGDLVFPNGVGEPLHGSHVYNKIFTPVLNATPHLDDVKKSEMRMYDLRHSHASYLLLRNTHPKVVSERLGHSSVQLTLDTYSHVLPSLQYEAAQVVESLYDENLRVNPQRHQRAEDRRLAPLKRELRQELSAYCEWLSAQ